jgi:signal transduction histidine kinase
MVITNCAYQLFMQYRTYHDIAQKNITNAGTRLINEIVAIQKQNREIAQALENDPSFRQAYSEGNRTQVAQVIKNLVDRYGHPGFVAVIDEHRRVFYSSDTPLKYNYSLKVKTAENVEYAFAHNSWCGPTDFSVAGGIAITAMVPIAQGPKVLGVVAVSQPIDSTFLTGLSKKLELSLDPVKGIDLVLFSLSEQDKGKVIAFTPGLIKTDGNYIAKLNGEGLAAVRFPSFEINGRIWQPFKLEKASNNIVGLIFVTTRVPDILQKAIVILGQALLSGVIGIILALFFSAAISGRFNSSMNFLIQRAQDLAQHKPDLPSLNKLSSEWVELAEAIDTAVAYPRTSVQSLKTQMTKHTEELNEKTKLVDAANVQVATVNKQLMTQSRQLSELSKQVNYANQQAVLLQQKLGAVLQISSEGFLLLDQYGNVLAANPVILNWMGTSEAEIAGKHCFDLVKKAGAAANDEPAIAFSHHGGNSVDLISQFYPEGIIKNTNKNTNTDVLIHLHPVMADESQVAGYVMAVRDKSVQSGVARLRADIISMLSDSLRAPLISAEGEWHSILDTVLAKVDPSVGQSLVELRLRYQQIIGVIDSLLMMYGGFVPPNAYAKEPVSVTPLVGQCLEKVAHDAKNHQILLDYKTITGLPNANVDREILQDVILKLLQKMISVTAPGGRVRAESVVKGNEIRLSIASSGPALSQDDIAEMFVGFIEGKHAKESYSSRLNMYLARNNVERIGGRVWAESGSGRGTVIYLTLPT